LQTGAAAQQTHRLQFGAAAEQTHRLQNVPQHRVPLPFQGWGTSPRKGAAIHSMHAETPRPTPTIHIKPAIILKTRAFSVFFLTLPQSQT